MSYAGGKPIPKLVYCCICFHIMNYHAIKKSQLTLTFLLNTHLSCDFSSNFSWFTTVQIVFSLNPESQLLPATLDLIHVLLDSVFISSEFLQRPSSSISYWCTPYFPHLEIPFPIPWIRFSSSLKVVVWADLQAMLSKTLEYQIVPANKSPSR